MDRQELRTFLALGARADRDGIPTPDIERQEDTVLRALTLLETQPGVVLADEVGMGKTFEALGVVAAFRRRNPHGRVVILTPGPDLNTKWANELARFSAGDRPVHDFGSSYVAVRRLDELVGALETHHILVAPINVFGSNRGTDTQAHLLSLFFDWKNIHGHTANAILRRFRDGAVDRIDARQARFLGHATYDQIAPHLAHAFSGVEESEPTLDDIYATFGFDGFSRDDLVRRALDTARFRLVRSLLPEIDLVVLDEAHKLKNADTVRSRAVSAVFAQKFSKALFLTATPFQLDIGELRQVFKLFSLSKTAPGDLVASVEGLFADIRDYQQAYAAFESSWLRVDPAVAEAFAEHYRRDPTLADAPEDPTIRDIASRVRRLFELKRDKIEPAFRRWMIRSVREDKRQYRRHTRHRNVPDATSIPFLLYERFLAELFRQGQQTHKASVEINMVSSYGAACEGALLASADGERFKGDLEVYRRLLRTVLDDLRNDGTDHPKMRFVLRDSIEAAERGEKTLVFCARIATLTDLARDIKNAWRDRLFARWQEVYPGESRLDLLGGSADDDHDGADDDKSGRERGRHGDLQRRFHAGNDALYLALRERYVQSLLLVDEWPLANLGAVVARANELLAEVRTNKSSASRLDYRIAKRCLERATALLWQEAEPSRAREYEAHLAQITDPRYVSLGLDLEADDLEEGGRDEGTETPSWTISEDVAAFVLAPRPGLWRFLSGLLDGLGYRIRVRMVERLARFLTYREVPFLVDVLSSAKASGLDVSSIESRALIEFLEGYWTTPSGRRWVDRIRAFLHYFIDRDENEQAEILDGPIATGQLVRQTREGESRERLREAFNTPLYPMILIANEVMQEGLDLHRNCRRVIHHDLAWNPAQLEQRVGRVDRLGSLTLQLRRKNQEAMLDVLYPLVHGTIDERMYRLVKTREKWLEFLLGAVPNYEGFAMTEAPPPPLPAGLAEALRIDLRPAGNELVRDAVASTFLTTHQERW